MSELKPCAHCGSNPCLHPEPTPGGTWYFIGCDNCGSELKRLGYAEAVAAWNRRVDIQPVAEPVAQERTITFTEQQLSDYRAREIAAAFGKFDCQDAQAIRRKAREDSAAICEAACNDADEMWQIKSSEYLLDCAAKIRALIDTEGQT